MTPEQQKEMQAAQEAIYRGRIRDVARTRGRLVTAEEMPPGTRVEFWTRSAHKDIPCWKGPAEVLNNEDPKSIALRWQGQLKSSPAHLLILIAPHHTSPRPSRPHPHCMCVGGDLDGVYISERGRATSLTSLPSLPLGVR